MSSTTQSKPKDRTEPDASGPDRTEPDAPEQEAPATRTVRNAADLSDRERAEVHRGYEALRRAENADEREEARERIRGVLGEGAEIGDHVITLANGETHRVEVPHGTTHNGLPVVSTYHDPQ